MTCDEFIIPKTVNCKRNETSKEKDCIKEIKNKRLYPNRTDCWEMWLLRNYQQVKYEIKELFKKRPPRIKEALLANLDRMMDDYEWNNYILGKNQLTIDSIVIQNPLYTLRLDPRSIYLFNNFKADFETTKYSCNCVDNYRYIDTNDATAKKIFTCKKKQK